MPTKLFLFLWYFSSAVVGSFGIEPAVVKVVPNRGSLVGGTMIHVHGQGFANDQFSFQDPRLGNRIVLKSDKHEVECDITPTDVSEKRVACETRPNPTAVEGVYQVVMFVNGERVKEMCVRRSSLCTFMFYRWRTPTLDGCSPRAAPAGTPVKLSGKIHTTQFSRLSPGFSPEKKEITRVYVGLECNPFNDNTNELFGAEIEDCGWTPNCKGSFTCLPKTHTAGSHTASYLVSGLGRSQVDKDLLRVNRNQVLYIYQSHSDIQSVSPSSGSIQGGTVLTIQGVGFSNNVNNVKVFVAGVPCEVLFSTPTMITCRTGPRGEAKSIYQGSRGLLREIWTSTINSNLSHIDSLTPAAPDYHVEYLVESSSPEVDTFNKTSGYSSKITGFFVPPQADNYTFCIQCDDKCELWLSSSEDPAGKTKIVSCSSASKSWNNCQKSKSPLEADKPYYLLVYHSDFASDHHVRIRVGLEKSSHTNAEYGGARQEQQQIKISSKVDWEKQVLNFTNWNANERACEVQHVSIEPLQCEETNITSCSDNFTLFYNDENVTLSLQDTNSAVLQRRLSELNAFQGRGPINVTSVNDGNATNATMFRVSFCFTDPRGVKVLNGSVADNQALTLNVSRLMHGQSAQDFRLVFDQPDMPSNVLTPSRTKENIEMVFEDWFSVKCSDIPTTGRWFVEDYEGTRLGQESGERVSDVEPFCGRKCLKNPTIIWKAEYSADPVNRPQPAYKISTYKWFCFAYKGPIKDEVRFQVKYEKDSEDQYAYHTYAFDRSSARSNWGCSCINVWEKIRTEYEQNSPDVQPTSIDMNKIEIVRLEGEGQHDIFIDNVLIVKNEIAVKRISSGAKPNGFLIKDFKVEKSGTNWTISLLPAKCGSPLPLLSVVDAVRGENANHDSAELTVKGLTSNVTVTRLQRASPRVRGTFNIEYNGKIVNDIPANISETRLKDRLEEAFEEGIIAVERDGTCAGFQWKVTWTTSGGNHPPMQVSGNGLTGSEVVIEAQTNEDGILYLDPNTIPGEFLRMPKASGEVVVIVNDITGSCNSNNCGFQYSAGQTPNFTSISPSSGSGGPAGVGTVITLGGSGFSSVNEENIVMIGGSKCVTQTSAANSITCRADYGPGGKHEVKISVHGKGLAANEQRLNFTYDISATSVTPSSGSTAGGREITIYGSGFGSSKASATVSLGGSPCDIISINMSQITCTTSAHAAGTVSVDVTIGDSSATVPNAFTYDASMNIQVTSVSPLQGSVSGGDLITISGSGFLGTTVVKVGNGICVTQSSSSAQITCVTPRHAPGKFAIKLVTPGRGFAVTPEEYKEFEFAFVVHSIFPLNGSIAGGTHVAFTGRGFNCSESRTAVTVQGKPCKITSCNATHMTCETNDTFKTVVVDNSGSHPEFGRGYEWKPKQVTCYQGDTIKWNWVADALAEVTYNIHQTTDSSASEYDGSGFRSGTGKTGSFQHRFLEPGVYYYAGSGSVLMKGVITVLPITKTSGPISFKTDGYEALYNITSLPSSAPTCESGRIDAVPGCNSSSLAEDSGRSFTYSLCSTPKVSSVSPAQATSNVLITIRGSGFSDVTCHNKVTFNSHVCQVVFSNETTITCQLSTAESPPAAEPLRVAVKVLNRGFALVKAAPGETTQFVLKPSITAVSPSTGSQAGGTRVTITGKGFSGTVNNNAVRIGDATCDVTNSTYTSLVCITRASNDDQPQHISVSIGAFGSECVAANSADCKYAFAPDRTPVVNTKTPDSITTPQTQFRFVVSRLPSQTSDVTVKVGKETCSVTSIDSSLLTCSISGAVVGSQKIVIHVSGKGNANFDGVSDAVTSQAIVSSVSPPRSSTNGGLTVTITGNGFDPTPGKTSVDIGGAPCKKDTVTFGQIRCVTPPHAASGSVTLQVTVSSSASESSRRRRSVNSFPASTIAFTVDATPLVTSLSPSTGRGGDTLTLSGSRLDPIPSNGEIIVRIGDVPCAVTSSTASSVVCTLAAHAAGSNSVDVVVTGKGRATTSGLSFEYGLGITGVTPNESGFGGGRVLVLEGHGFDNSSEIKICGNECTIKSDPAATTTQIACEAPSHPNYAAGIDQQCDIVITLNGLTTTLPGGFTYKIAMTSRITSVTPPQGGTGGGTTLTISGTGFSNTLNENVVTIDGTPCAVTSATSTEIVCSTGNHSRTIETKVRVDVGSNGKALDDGGYFFYVDVWSSPYTWGNNPPPRQGELAVIKKGQTILLDQDTPVLKLLLIQGGKLIFDAEKPSLHLQAELILITDNGTFQVGTEDDPFPGNATITLHGHVRSREIPVFGTKAIALREGTLDLHGLHVPITWTHLSSTADVGATELHLMQAVTWKQGDQIVLAPTGKSQRESEVLTITAVLNANKTLQVTPALRYKHISIVQTFNGVHRVETRAEVGMLTRNVKVRGSVHDQWTEKIEACPKEFAPGQFQTQSCFQGKFGEEIGSDEFGATIMIHASEKSKNLVTARFSNVEISHAGQAFRLGRYPIHFHLSGDVTGSYVRRTSIHHSFNRCITMHGIHNLHVSHNVVYNARGNCFFMEDGIETGNVVEYNLGIFVTASSSALNVDITPATYWVTNANNTVRHNAAAGGSHFGFWYQMFEHPDGPSFTPDYCPRNVPMLEFFNNSAHSFGRYGLWVFPTYHPLRGGRCHSSIAAPAKFDRFIAYNNMRGAEAVQVGAVQFHDFKMLDNDIAGIEYVFTNQKDVPRGGPKIVNALIVGHSEASEGLELKIKSNTNCTESGIKLPQYSKLVVENVTFVNFNQLGCTCYRACAQCKEFKKRGGWTTHTSQNHFVNSPRRFYWQWSDEGALRDLDGSVTGYVNGTLVPSNAALPPQHCTASAPDSYGEHGGSVCDGSVQFHRFAFKNAAPGSLRAKNVLFTNQHGTNVVPYCVKCATHPQGWMTMLIEGERYNMTFENASQITNITYSGLFYDLNERDHIWISHKFTQTPDHFTTTGAYQNMTDVVPSADAQHGNWSFVNDTKVFTYIASGKNGARTINNNIETRPVQLLVYRCFYEDCIIPVPPPPPKGRPAIFRRWSNVDDWEGTEPMYGGYGRRLPTNGSDVMIQEGWYMLADVQLPYLNKLEVFGTLEIGDPPGESMVINATIIFITGGLIVGWPDTPYPSNLLISLRGDVNSEEYLPFRGVNVGGKALAAFGFLWLHGKPKAVCWTRLSVTAQVGDRFLILAEPVDWDEGDEIVITSTTVEPQQTEKFFIIAISQDRRNLTLNAPLLYKHIAEVHTAGNWTYTLAAEVGRLTRNIVIEGADNPPGAWQQSFGCRVLVSGSARIEHVEFRRCGQEGWTDDFDPRFSLAFINVGNVEGNTSYVRCNAIHDGFNTGIGVFKTDNLTIEDNIVHHTVGSSFQVAGTSNRLYRNLAVYSISIHTYNGRRELSNVHWPGAIEVHKATDVTLINNTVAGSERFGFKIDGVPCIPYYSPENSTSAGNVVHGAWYGVQLHYFEGISGCSMISGYLTWGNLDYGIFIYPKPSVIVDSVIVVDNTVGIFPNIWSPKALSHVTENKFFTLRHSLIVGTSPSYDCADDSIVPYARIPFQGLGAKKAPGGGKIGITMTLFGSSPAAGPKMPWENPMDYPAINGYTLYDDVTFSGFQMNCSKRHRAIMTNSWVGDIMHPVDVRGLHYFSVDEKSKLWFEKSTIKWINPSDCVDMDCDGRRQLLIRDLDGSLTGDIGGAVISQAEKEWDGDRRFGLGDYRIPKPALTAPDGSRLNVSVVAPHKGIVRGSRDHSTCTWYDDWNAYKCSSRDYRMLVIESLDPDTETRRLSPVALIANGYVNLLNGPMDHGWCLGYTCQERISTFYGIVSTGTNYSLYFTSTEPQKLRLHLLNSDPTDVIRVGIFYKQPQRQDVYRNGVFMNPENGRLGGAEFTTVPIPAGEPDDYFVPPLTSHSGANYYDRRLATLFVVVRGSVPVEIRVMAVVQVSIGVQAVSVDDFFKENLLSNLVALLGIEPSRVRIVDIVSASGSRRRRRRRRSSADVSQVVIEIGDPPLASNSSESSNYTGVNISSSIEDLKQISDNVVDVVQRGALAQQANVTVVSLSISDPIPPPVDLTGGVRATNETGGPNITDNSTLRYDQLQAQQEEQAPSNVFSFLIPNTLELVTEPNGGNETVVFTVQPRLKMVDIDGKLVTNLGHGSLSNWTVTASILVGTGDPMAVLEGNVSVTIVEGWANFTDLSITHNGSDYKLVFNVSKPAASHFNATSQSFEVKERILYYTITVQPSDANETVSFGQQPRIEVRDAANGEIVDNTGWKRRRWLFRASLANPNANDGHLNGTTEVEFIQGVAQFTNLSVDISGENYILALEAMTVPSSRYVFSDNSSAFNVSERMLYLKLVQQPGDCNDTVICGSQPILEIRNVFPDTLVDNIGWRGRTWQINATMVSASNDVLNGSTLLSVPTSGRVEFQDLNFYDIAQDYEIQFTVVTEPSSSYSGLAVTSETFNVSARQFYLEVITQPARANQSEVFGVSPVVEVRDLGTRTRGRPLKGDWSIGVSLKPSALNGTLSGDVNVSVSDERAEFGSLSISYYGIGYQLAFESNYGHLVYSQPFEVKYVNDYSPVFDPQNGLYNATISEDASIGLSVTMVTATDQDSGSQGDVSYSIVAGNTGNKFAIDTTLGNISTIGELDRETTAVFTLTVRASDGAVPEKVRYADGTVEVFISDVNDNAPSFNTSSIVTTAPENASIGDVIITLQAYDPDEGLNSEVRYSIKSGNDVGLFTLNSTTGELQVNASYDLDQEPRPNFNHSLVIFVEDLGTPERLNSSVQLNISITAVNEFTPQLLHASSFNFSFAENAAVGDGVTVVRVNATDQDYGDQGRVSYVIHSGNGENKFTINASTGELKLVSTFDYENASSYTVVIHASDNDHAGNVKYAIFTVYVSVLDMNDNAPEFSQSLYQVNVGEDAAIGSSVFTFLASDPDGGLNGLVSYSVVFSNSSEFWNLNSSTGELTVNASLDMDTGNISTWTHTLVVMAKDAGTPMLHANATLLIHVLLVNEFAPSFASSDLQKSVSEGIAVGSVIYQGNATDGDFGSDGEIRYSITSGNNDLKFFINSVTGEMTTLAALDRESQDIYHLVVQAQDMAASGQKKTGTTTVHLSLSDVNDNAPSFPKNYYSELVDENVTTGGEVLTVQATDPDLGTNGNLIYSIASGNDQGFFSIESNQGIIRAAKSLDIETQNHSAGHAYNLVIFVTDQGTPDPLNNSVPVTITVQSVNEFAPILSHPESQVIELSENTSVSQAVYDVNATDQDYGDDGVVSYSITSGNNLGYFAIDNVTGVITLVKELDFETISQHNLVITVTDNSQNINHRRRITARLEVQVINIDDSETYSAEVRMLQTYIASPTNPAGVAGIPEKSALEIRLVYENGTAVDITKEADRYTLDAASKSNNLFSVMTTDGTPFVVANGNGLAGLGQLLVHVANVKIVEVNVTVVGSSLLTVKAASYPEIPGAIDVTELKQIIPGKYQRVLLTVLLNLTNGDQLDVSLSLNTSFVFTNALQVGGTFEFGPVPQSVFSITGNGLSGSVTLQAVFANSLSASVNLTLSSTVLKLVAITRFGLENVNTTLSGVAVVTTASPFAEVRMEDGSIHLLNNFTMYSGLLTFNSSDPSVVSVDSASGVVTLLTDSSSRVTITARVLVNTSITATASFYCNLQPGVGEVDIGATEGPAIPSLAKGETWKMPVTMNPGTLGILAVHVEIWFNTSHVSLVNVTTDLPYSVAGNTIQIFGPLAESKALSENIAQVVFTSLKNGVPQVNYQSFRTVNKELATVPSKSVTSCSNVVLGDIDSDCTFDIVDIAFISAYIASSASQFTDNLGARMTTVSSSQRSSMDVNWNEAVESKDAIFLSFIFLEKAKFVTELTYKLPNHDGTSSDKCTLHLAVKLANKDGSVTSSSQAETYFLLSHSAANVAEQFSQTTFTAGTKLSVEGSSSVQGLIKASYGNSKFSISAEESKLESSDVGVSIVQDVPFNGKRYVASMFVASNLVSAGDVDAAWATSQASEGFTPQRKLQFSESTATCNDPPGTVNVVITFEGDYDAIVQGNEAQFESQCDSQLSAYYPDVTISGCRVSKGSIVVSFNLTAPDSKRNATLAKIWEDVKEGLKLVFNGATITTLPLMKVDGKDYSKTPVESPEDESKMPVYIIVVVCVAAFVVLLILLIVFYCLYRGKQSVGKINPSPPSTPDGFVENEKGREMVSNYVAQTANTSLQSLGQLRTVSPLFRRPTPIAFSETVEPAVEEREQLPTSQRPTLSKEDSADLPKTVLAFTAVPTKKPTPSPQPPRNQPARSPTPQSIASVQTSRTTSPVGQQPPSEPGDASTDRAESPDVVSSANSAQSPPLSPSILWPECDDNGDIGALEDNFDDDELEDGIREEAILRRRASSMDFDHEVNFAEMPGVLTAWDAQTKRRKMQVKVIRPNPELGVLAHMAGVVKINPSGTLKQMREDINHTLPGYLGSVRYLFLTRKFKIIDPRTEKQLVVSGVYKKTVYVKVFHGAENCEYFCLCGKVAYMWCPKCNVQGYCGDECREQDESEHSKLCSRDREKAMQEPPS